MKRTGWSVGVVLLLVVVGVRASCRSGRGDESRGAGPLQVPAAGAALDEIDRVDARSAEPTQVGPMAPESRSERSQPAPGARLTVFSRIGSVPLAGAHVYAASAAGCDATTTDELGSALVASLPCVALIEHAGHAPYLAVVEPDGFNGSTRADGRRDERDAASGADVFLEPAGSLTAVFEDARGRRFADIEVALAAPQAAPGALPGSASEAHGLELRQAAWQRVQRSAVADRLRSGAVSAVEAERLREAISTFGADSFWSVAPAATSDADGRAVWPVVPAGPGYRLKLLSRHWLEGLEREGFTEPFDVPRDELTEVRVAVRASATLTGRIVLSDGGPARGAQVVLRRHQQGGPGPGGTYSADNEGHHFERAAECDDDGVFQFANVLPGLKSINASLWRAQAAELDVWHTTREVVAFEDADVGALWLLGETLEAVPRFVDDSGNAIGPERVLDTSCFECRSWPEWVARTDPCSSCGAEPGSESPAPSAARVSVHVLQIGAPVSVSVPAPIGATFRVCGLLRGQASLLVRESTEPWEWREGWRARAALPLEFAVELPQARLLELPIRVVANRRIVLSLTNANRVWHPGERVRVDVVSVDGALEQRERVSVVDAVLLLPTGDYLAYFRAEALDARDPTGGYFALQRESSGGDSDTWQVLLEPAARLAGVVVARDGQALGRQVLKFAPEPMAEVSCYPVRVRSDDRGRFVADGLPASGVLRVFGARASIEMPARPSGSDAGDVTIVFER